MVLEFQLVDVRVLDTVPLGSPRTNADLCAGELYAEVQRHEEAGLRGARELVVFLFGRGDDGDVCALVRGFRPELYYDVCPGDRQRTVEACQAEPALRAGMKSAQRDALAAIARVSGARVAELRAEWVTRYDAGDLALDDAGDRLPRVYLRVSFASAWTYRKACYATEAPRPHHTPPTLESKFSVATNTWPSHWVRIEGELRVVERRSFCTHECECTVHQIRHLDRDDVAPLRVGAMDIECISEQDAFPLAELDDDVVCSVALVVWNVGQPASEASRKHCVIWHGAAPVDATFVHRADDEEDLFLKFRDLLIDEGVDIVAQYNGFGFDWPYMEDRAAAPQRNWLGFRYMSKLRFHACRFERKKMASAARGDQKVQFYSMPGRCNFDVLQWYMSNYKKPFYNLDYVCGEHTGEHKEDLDYRLIKPYWRGTPEQRALLVTYNVQDCEILRKLCDLLGTWIDQVEQSRTSRVIMERLVTHGQSIKVVSQFNAKCHAMEGSAHTYVMSMHHQRWRGHEDDDAHGSGEKYEGATVVEPKPGLYTKLPVVVNDFSSLYPSIMISHNLCNSTNVRRPQDRAKPGVEVHELDGVRTHFSTRAPGIMSTMLKDTLARRKLAKKEKERLEQARERLRQRPDDDPEFAEFGGKQRLIQLIEVMDKRQLALKVSANSVYGFTGAEVGSFPDRDVASTTTFLGRGMLQESVETAEALSRTLTKRDGTPVGVFELVYGDSVADYTPLLLRDAATGALIVSTCDTLVAEDAWVATADGKEAHALHGRWQTWTQRGWTPVACLIRHRVAKPMYRVTTHTGTVDVTEDHSLLRDDGTELAPRDVAVGTRLLHAPMDRLGDARAAADDSITCGMARILGMFAGDGSCGVYDTKWGRKFTWALNNKDAALQARYKALCEEELGGDFKVLDTLASSGVYKLVPVKDIKGPTLRFRDACYDAKGRKRVPSAVLNGSADVMRAFLCGLYDADGSKGAGPGTRHGGGHEDMMWSTPKRWQNGSVIDQKSETIALGIFVLLRRLGYNVSLNTRPDKPHIYTLRFTMQALRRDATAVKRIQPIDYVGEYVYDLTTECEPHHFHAGVGELEVHNTDSIMFTLSEVTTPRDGADAGIAVGRAVTERFHARGHMAKKLEFEKAFQPYILFKKKKYAGIKYEENGDDGMRCKGVSYSGTANKRRDSCDFVHHVYNAMIEAILYRSDLDESLRAFHEHMRRLVEGKVPYEDLVITKSVKSSYKLSNSFLFRPLEGKQTDGRREVQFRTEEGRARLEAALARGQRGFTREEWARFDVVELRTDSCVAVEVTPGEWLTWVPAESANLAQLKVIEKQEARERGSGAKSGTRMGMIMVRPASSQQKVTEQAEDARYVIEHKLPVDEAYYIVNQCKNPCESLLQFLAPNYGKLIEHYKKEAERVRSGTARLDRFLKVRPRPAPAAASVDEESPEAATGEGAAPSSAAPSAEARAAVKPAASKRPKTAPPVQHMALARFLKPKGQ